MYRSNDAWDEAIRVAKYHGGVNASKRVAYAWALALGGDAGSKLLTKLGLIEPAIDYAIESGAFGACCSCALHRGAADVLRVLLLTAPPLPLSFFFPTQPRQQTMLSSWRACRCPRSCRRCI